MDTTGKQLVELLSAAIQGHQCPKEILEVVNWEALLEEARAHDVYPLLYPIIKSIDTVKGSEAALLTKWGKACLREAGKQIHHINQICKIIHVFNQNGISVIILKGLVLRELYPHPELRTMVDADLLVQEKDFQKGKSILIQNGYYEDSKESDQISFRHNFNNTLELHTTLAHNHNFKNLTDYNKKIWDRSALYDFFGEKVLALSPVDQVIHIVLHMAEHMKAYGFGLRQLCDLVLLVKSKEHIINWDKFIMQARELGIEQFSYAVFTVCKELFEINVPFKYISTSIENDAYIDMFIEDILSGGVFGYRDTERLVGIQLLRYSGNTSAVKKLRKLSLLMSYLFPKPDSLGTRYAYAKKNPILYPIAWIHRLFYNMYYRDLNAVAQISFSSSEKPMKVYLKRARLLQWLQLK